MHTGAPHKFDWYELTTPDVPAALDFYRRVFGWQTKDSGLPGMAYTLLQVGEQAIGGSLTLTPEMRDAGAMPGWLGYIRVDDLAATVDDLVAAGGKIIRPIFEIPGVIRFAIVADPHGAVFAMYRGLVEGNSMPAFAPGTPGAVDWHELHAGDGAAAWAFYAKLFGWSKADAMDMGAMGAYQMWTAGGPPIGGMMTKMPDTPAPFWLFYVCVEGIEAAIERVKQGWWDDHPRPDGSARRQLDRQLPRSAGRHLRDGLIEEVTDGLAGSAPGTTRGASAATHSTTSRAGRALPTAGPEASTK